MDDMRMHARNDATSLVARDFEPTRIERQLLARAFELLCEIQSQPTENAEDLAEKQFLMYKSPRG